MLEVKNLTVRVPGFVLKDITLEVKQGDFFAVIGPTGSGKSLLLESIVGILPENLAQYSGKIVWKGRDITFLPPNRRGFGIVYQESALFPHLRVKENVCYGLRYLKISPSHARERFDLVVERLGIGPLLERFPARLSGGERQRVALARVLMLRPRVILLDEPISALDPLFQDDIRELLQMLHREFGLTFVMVSHNLEDVMHLAQRGAVMHRGSVVQQGKIVDIFERPASTFVARFVGAVNVFPASLEGRRAGVGPLSTKTVGGFSARASGYMSIRPEYLVPVLEGRDGSQIENCFEGIITRVRQRNFQMEVGLEVQGVRFTALWQKDEALLKRLEVGNRIKFGFFPNHVNVFSDE